MKNFEIIPQSLILTNLEAKSPEDAMVNFATTMDLDMNTYVKEVPEENVTDEIVNLLVKAIENNKLSSGHCSQIFRALEKQDEVIGGKFWTKDDIETSINKNFGDKNIIVTKAWRDAVADTISCLRYNALEEESDEEWNVIRNAVKDSNLKVNVNNIDWDLDPEDFVDEVEMMAVKENVLPESVDIPLADLEYNVKIDDWLSEHYDYFFNAYCVDCEVSE